MVTVIKKILATLLILSTLLTATPAHAFDISSFLTLYQRLVQLLNRSSQTAAVSGAGSGLVAHYTFDEGSGTTANDSSGNNNTGTLTNGPTWVSGKVGSGAVSFDEVDDYVRVSSNGGITDYPVTFSAWVNTTSGGSIVGVFSSGSSGTMKAIQISDGKAILRNTNANSDSGTVTVNDGEWHHIVGIFEASDSRRLYVDGVLDGSWTNAIGTFPTIDRISTGRLDDATPSTEFSGKIDDTRVYNRVLSALEIKALYNAGASKLSTSKTSVTDGLVGHWTFDGKDMLTGLAQDISGNDNHGSLVSMATSTSRVEGKVGQALNFDGSDDLVVREEKIVTGYPFTFSGWIKSDGTQKGSIVSFSRSGIQDGDSGAVKISMGINASGFAYLEEPIFGSALAVGTSDIRNKWTHVTGVFLGSSERKLYVNGVLEDTDVGTGSFSSFLNTTTVGAVTQPIPVDKFKGLIDDVRVYNRALSEEEIKTIYNETAAQKINTAPKVQDDASTGLSAGLVGHWTFDGKDMLTGLARDTSGNDNHGSLVSIATSTSRVEGKVGQALNFDGSDDWVRVNSAVVNDPPFTLAGWVKVESGGAPKTIIAIVNDSVSTEYARIFIAGEKGTLGIRDDAGNEVVVSGAADLNDGWHHVVGVFRATDDKALYIDGVLVGTSNENHPGLSANITSIGVTARSNIFNYMRGSIDDVRVYNRALTSSEVQQLYMMNR